MKKLEVTVEISRILERVMLLAGSEAWARQAATPQETAPVLTADNRDMAGALAWMWLRMHLLSLSPWVSEVSARGEGSPDGVLTTVVRTGRCTTPLLMESTAGMLADAVAHSVAVSLAQVTHPAVALGHRNQAKEIIGELKTLLRGIDPHRPYRILPHYY